MGVRIGRFEHKHIVHWGVVGQHAVWPLSGTYPTLRALLTAESRAVQLGQAALAQEGIPLSEVRWLSPVDHGAQVVCQGVNYAGHRREGGYAPEKPSFNTIFTKASSAICGPNDDVIRPPHVRLLDYEVELGVVISKAITEQVNITPENLCQYVAGIVITNDISARDVQIPQGQWIKGKSYRTFCPVGPYLYLLDDGEGDVIDDLELKLWVNGDLRQSASTSQLLFKPAETLAELSGVMDLFPGDLLMTGTPSGVALKMPQPLIKKLTSLLVSEDKQMDMFVRRQLQIPAYLQDGDLIRAIIRSPSGHVDLGVQENRVVRASLRGRVPPAASQPSQRG
jgi:2-keto-4-pentenoate hydratase/2-oxohepta-3-ene-1,7-dioic acid hydratase in catechol pathway